MNPSDANQTSNISEINTKIDTTTSNTLKEQQWIKVEYKERKLPPTQKIEQQQQSKNRWAVLEEENEKDESIKSKDMRETLKQKTLADKTL